MILKPQNLKIFGNNISIGDYATLITAPDKRIDLSTWETDKINGEIQLGKYILISPGTSIRSAKKITIGESFTLKMAKDSFIAKKISNDKNN